MGTGLSGVQRGAENPRVGSSILPLATRFKGLASAEPIFSLLRILRQADTICISVTVSLHASNLLRLVFTIDLRVFSGPVMKINLSKIERTRLDNLMFLYLFEYGDEDSGIPGDSNLPTAYELASALQLQDLDVDVDTLQSILDERMAISDEMAEMIEKAFLLSPGRMSE